MRALHAPLVVCKNCTGITEWQASSQAAAECKVQPLGRPRGHIKWRIRQRRQAARALGAEPDKRNQLSPQDYFESLVRRQKASGSDFASKAAELLKETGPDVEVPAKRTELDAKAQPHSAVEEGFLKLGQARDWLSGRREEPPANSKNDATVVRSSAEERRAESDRQYKELKKDLFLTTAAVIVAIDAYTFLTFGWEEVVSYAIGGLSSIAYLFLLIQQADKVSRDDIPEIFRRRRTKRKYITSEGVVEALEKGLRGSSLALSSPRLVVLPAMWLLSQQWNNLLADSTGLHVKVVPLVLGFFAYKGAAIIQVWRSNKDLELDMEWNSEPREDLVEEPDLEDLPKF